MTTYLVRQFFVCLNLSIRIWTNWMYPGSILKTIIITLTGIMTHPQWYVISSYENPTFTLTYHKKQQHNTSHQNRQILHLITVYQKRIIQKRRSHLFIIPIPIAFLYISMWHLTWTFMIEKCHQLLTMLIKCNDSISLHIKCITINATWVSDIWFITFKHRHQ